MSAAPGFRSIVLAALPAAAAILVFGLLYGAAARPLLGPGVTVVLSLVVFSGALQFALVGLSGRWSSAHEGRWQSAWWVG